jgi:hypothetical protein
LRSGDSGHASGRPAGPDSPCTPSTGTPRLPANTMQTRYLILAALITALAIVVAAAVWFGSL